MVEQWNGVVEQWNSVEQQGGTVEQKSVADTVGRHGGTVWWNSGTV